MATPKRKRIPESVQKALKEGLREPQLAEISAYFFQAAGGTRAVAKMLWDEFNASAPGSLMRQRILDLVLKATKFANEKSGVVDDLGMLSQEDLERELQGLAWEVGQQGKKDEPQKETTPKADA